MFLESVSQACVYVAVSLKLSEECVLIFTEEKVGPEVYGHMVVYFIMSARPQVGVVICRRVVGKHGQPQVLIHQQFCQTDCN